MYKLTKKIGIRDINENFFINLINKVLNESKYPKKKNII
jgi:hypothetical protein